MTKSVGQDMHLCKLGLLDFSLDALACQFVFTASQKACKIFLEFITFTACLTAGDKKVYIS